MTTWQSTSKHAGISIPRDRTRVFSDWLSAQDGRDDAVGFIARYWREGARTGRLGKRYVRPETFRRAVLSPVWSRDLAEATDAASSEWCGGDGIFSDWLQRQRYRDDPVGDLARGFVKGARDGVNGRRYVRPERLREAMKEIGACDDALDALTRAEREWSGADE